MPPSYTSATNPHTLILMRHSEAADGGHDYARPLTARGRQLAALQGSAIVQATAEIDLALVSSAARTLQTLTAMRSAGLPVHSVSAERTLYSASPEEALNLIRATPESIHTLLVLFHQPAVAALTFMLTDPVDRPPSAQWILTCHVRSRYERRSLGSARTLEPATYLASTYLAPASTGNPRVCIYKKPSIRSILYTPPTAGICRNS